MSLERLIPYLAKTIKSRRQQLGLSPSEVAARTGLSAEYIEFIEAGGTIVSMKTLRTVAQALQYSTSELIEQAEQLMEQS